ncbi:GbsR/MarR family transcriptional regulator [Methanosarcina horonobensis]|uniref:GbsR/MarR family transcriptional regulator n=1 Tax=Methanosarcina horonobensis TaxID=418008 RepID=UPI000A98C24C|nr:winged helix-turn-helix transcriptional regulator [Methanosarcina horonobensis]
MIKNPRDEFIQLIVHNSKVQGLDELTSQILAVLFIEPEEIPLEELAEKTGYSLSAVSTASKFLASIGLIKKFRKPGSKKVYLFMEKDMISIGVRILRAKYENVILPTKQVLPGIIEAYKKKKIPKRPQKSWKLWKTTTNSS